MYFLKNRISWKLVDTMISHVVDFLKLRHPLLSKLLFKNKYNTLSPRKNETCFDLGALKIADISKQDIKIFEKSFAKLTNQPELILFSKIKIKTASIQTKTI